jgi:hypothetical protein
VAITFVLQENKMTEEPGGYVARVRSGSTLDLEGVVDTMLQRGSTTTRADIFAVLDDYHSAIEWLVLHGIRVLTPGANYYVRLRGVFADSGDHFDPSRHAVEPAVTPGRRFRRTIRRQAHVEKAEGSRPSPAPQEYLDIASGARNGVLTPGGLGRLTGYRLKFEESDPEQGIYFAPAAGGAEVRATQVGRNVPGELLFAVPELPEGNYALKVRARMKDTGVREGVLEALLTVS